MIYFYEVFWRHTWNVCTLVANDFEFLVFLSVCLLAYFLTEISQILRYLQFWIRYLTEIFQRHSWDVGTLVQNNSEFFVCLSLCFLAHFFPEITQILDISWSGWYIFLIFKIHSFDVHLFKLFLSFLYVCQSVSWLTLLLKLDKYRDISSSGWDIFRKFVWAFLECMYTRSK